jgi:hypothetical protein
VLGQAAVRVIGGSFTDAWPIGRPPRRSPRGRSLGLARLGFWVGGNDNSLYAIPVRSRLEG